MASAEVTAEIQLAPVNFVASDIGPSDQDRIYAVLAYIAAATLAQRGIHTLVVTADNTVNKDNIAALDEAEFPIPLGRCTFIVVGKEAFDLLPERTQQFVFDPPQPDKSDYFGAIGVEQPGHKSAIDDTADKLVEILNMILPHAGDHFGERWKTFGSGI